MRVRIPGSSLRRTRRDRERGPVHARAAAAPRLGGRGGARGGRLRDLRARSTGARERRRRLPRADRRRPRRRATTATDRPGWWDNIIGPGKPLDTDRFFVVCANLLGGCQGTTGPSSTDPATGRPYGLRFPLITVSDLVRVQRALVAHLGIPRPLAAVGGSLGGMQALQWALDAPGELRAALVICASSRLSAQNIAFSAVGREAIMSDPDFNGGDYHDTGVRPDRAATARMLAHITYLSEESMRRKFGRLPGLRDAPLRLRR